MIALLEGFENERPSQSASDTVTDWGLSELLKMAQKAYDSSGGSRSRRVLDLEGRYKNSGEIEKFKVLKVEKARITL